MYLILLICTYIYVVLAGEYCSSLFAPFCLASRYHMWSILYARCLLYMFWFCCAVSVSCFLYYVITIYLWIQLSQLISLICDVANSLVAWPRNFDSILSWALLDWHLCLSVIYALVCCECDIVIYFYFSNLVIIRP